MKLIIAQPYLFQKGGIERLVLELARRFNPVIYATDYRPENTYSELKEFDIRVLAPSTLETPFFFLKGQKEMYGAMSAGFRYSSMKVKEDYDVINAHAMPSNWIRYRNERVAWYCHGFNSTSFDLAGIGDEGLSMHKKLLRGAFSTISRKMEDGVIPKMEKIMTNSEYTNERLKSYYGRTDGQVIPFPVDAGDFENESYGKYFLYPSRISPEKRLEYAIEAFREFSKARKGWKLIFTGFLTQSERQARYFEKLKALAAGSDIEFRVNATPAEMKKLYANAYATLFCGIREGWGLVALESMASEKPCISVNEGGPIGSIVNGKTGFLVNSPQEMAEKMLYLAENPDKNEAMGRAGRKRVLEKYNWKLFLDNMERALKETAKENAR